MCHYIKDEKNKFLFIEDIRVDEKIEQGFLIIKNFHTYIRTKTKLQIRD